jgi:hypothetical protein
MNTKIIRKIIESTLVPHTAFENACERVEQCFTYSSDAVEPIGIALVGESRTGKSRVLEECEVNHPKKRTKKGLNVPILRVKTPSKPTVNGLVELMLCAIGDPKFYTGTENIKTNRLEKLMKNAGTRMVMIDEFQHFHDKGSNKVMHHVADWLKIFVDDTKVALVVAGLPSCQVVLDQNEQLAGRFLSPISMPRFDWSNDEHRDEYIAILNAFHESMSSHFKLPQLGNEEMAFRCYCATGGLIGYLTKFLRQSVWNAIDANQSTISLKDLKLAHDSAVWDKNGISTIASPFSENFSHSPTKDTMALIQKIGTRSEQAAESLRISKRKSKKSPSISQILSAS